MKVKTVVIGFVVIVILIAICRALGGEALLDQIPTDLTPEK